VAAAQKGDQCQAHFLVLANDDFLNIAGQAIGNSPYFIHVQNLL
jgi:hypothetical protein